MYYSSAKLGDNMSKFSFRREQSGAAALIGIVMLVAPLPAIAAEPAPFFHAPSASAPPGPKLAGLFELKLQLPQGHGLADLLLHARVDADDVVAADRLAQGHETGVSAAKVTLSRNVKAGEFTLERLVLTGTDGEQTVIERRLGQLAINPLASTPAKTSRLI